MRWMKLSIETQAWGLMRIFDKSRINQVAGIALRYAILCAHCF